jgi:hypothetical protein
MLLSVDTIAQNDSPLIKKGTVEISTIGSNYMGTNMLGFGISKVAGYWSGTLGMSVGYFPISSIGFEGSFGGIINLWADNSSNMDSVVIGKLVFSLVTEKGNNPIPYALGGIGFMNSRYSTDYSDDVISTDTLVTFGLGVKLPVKHLTRSAIRIEYSYSKNLDAENPLHNVSVGLSLFL